MNPLDVGLVLTLAMVGVVYVGVHVGIALILVSFVGIWLIRDSVVVASQLLAMAAGDSIANYVFGVVPLFVLMGVVVSESDIGRDTFDVAQVMVRRVKGGLGIATVAANAVFAAITGVSVASAAVFTKISVPEMTRLGYRPRFAVGVVAGSSVLGMLIPPSLLLILYGILSDQSIGTLFIAGVVPGILLAGVFSLGIFLLAELAPNFVGGPKRPEAGSQARIGAGAALSKLGPIAALIVLVMGGIYGGIFTPTEAAAVGAFLSMVIALARGRLTFPKIWEILLETGQVSVSIFFLIIAASIYSRMLAMSGIPDFIGTYLAELKVGLYGFILIYMVVLLLLGMIVDAASTMLIAAPLAIPVAQAFGADPIWFGIVTVIGAEVGLLTPPFGMSVYAVKATLADQSITLADIFSGAFPFVMMMMLVLLLVCIFPWFALVLVKP
jgi:tripartite ATP-independent transporter DctM subunit